MGTNDAVFITGEVYRGCAEIFGQHLHDVYLYGSYARGDFDNESDVDILLTVDMNQKAISLRRNAVAHLSSSLSLEHDVTVSITVVPLEQFTRFSEVLPYYRNVFREGIRYAV